MKWFSACDRLAALRLLFTALLLLGLTGGCGSPSSSSNTKSKAAAQRAAKARPAPTPTVSVKPNEYSSIEQAVEALGAAAEANDSEGLRKAESWLALQGGKATAALGAVLNDEQADLKRRLAACRAVARSGPSAKSVMFQAMQSQSELVRINATKWIGIIKPVDKELVQRLIETMNHEEEQMRKYAILSLKTIGAPANDSVSALIEKLNDTSETPQVRDAAKQALKKINPRHTLQD